MLDELLGILALIVFTLLVYALFKGMKPSELIEEIKDEFRGE